MMGSLRARALVLVLVPMLAVTAAAQPSAKDKQQASELVKRAIAKSQAGEHAVAIDLYLEAYKIIPQPLLLSNIGSEYQQLRKPVEALKYFCKYIEADPTGNNVGYATAQARALHMEIVGDLSIQDRDLCKPISKPAAVLPPPPPEPQPAPQPQPQPAPEPQPTPPVVDNGPQTTTPAIRYVGIGLAVVGAGAFGGGVYFGLEAKKISDEITNHDMDDPWPADIKEREADGKSAEKKQIALMIGGGLALAAGVTMFFVGSPKTESSASVSIAPVATGDTLGFAAAGRF